MKKIISYLLLFFFLKNGFAQKAGTIPFEELIGGVILIKAQVGNYPDTLNFIFDTGSSHISLDSTTATILNIKQNKTDLLSNGVGGLRKMTKSDPMTIKMSNIKLDSLIFNINNYDILTESFGVRIDGIVGYAFLSKFIFNVNFDSALINVYPTSAQVKYPKKGFRWNYYMYKIPYDQIAVTDAKVTKANYYIDCGAGLCLLLTENFVKDSSILLSNKKPLKTQVDGVGGKSNMRITTIKQFKIGKFTFKNVPTFLYNDETELLGYPGVVGLVGNDILRRFNWVLNYKEKFIYLTPNKNYREKFDYSYTGLGIYLIDGLITVTDIVKDSPGEKAGLKEGDVIISIDNTIVTEVKKAKELFQQANKKVKLIIIRNQKPIEVKMKIGRIK